MKLWQFDPVDQEQIAIDLNAAVLIPDPAIPGVSRAALAKRDYETVTLESWEPGTEAILCDEGGFEMLILEGEVSCAGAVYARHDWIRWPANQAAAFIAGSAGARSWIKRGHLREIRAPQQA